MKNILIALTVLVLGGLAYYFLVMRPSASEVELQPPALLEQPAAIQPAEVEMPVAEPFESQPGEAEPFDSVMALPPLEHSDAVVLEAATSLIGETAVMHHVVTENIVARLVATIDALTGRQVSGNLLPLQPPGGALEVTEDTNPAASRTTPEGDPIREFLMDPVNYQRYDTSIDLLESVSTDEMLTSYLHYQPWFQQTYVELGYPEGDFNSRLLEVIDHLLDAPEVAEPVRLVKPEAYYLFADPQLEALTAGQKLMIRMGSSNARKVKSKLAEIRAALEVAGAVK